VTDWKRSAVLPVLVEGLGAATYVGWVMASQTTESDRLAVLVDGRLRAVASAHVRPTPDAGLPRAPWFRASVHVWRLPAVSNLLGAVFKERAPGMPVTFMQVFQALAHRGIPVFVVGGAVRDAVQGRTDIKDIDMAYGCSAAEMRRVAAAEGWPVAYTSPNGLVQLGEQKAKFALEGKSLNGFNSDVADFAEPRVCGCDLTRELSVRDFTCNSLFYDPLNGTVLDPSGVGVADARARRLRIPVAQESWSEWVRGNPTKLLRYWKMVSRDYSAADAVTRAFILATAQREFRRSRSVYFSLARCKAYVGFMDASDAAKFRKAVEADLGRDFRWTYFG
jgi:hypothetical protein